MRIAITGASGLLGRAAVRALRSNDLVLLGRSSETLRRHFPRGSCIETDYSQASLQAALQGCGAVIHLAAVRYHPEFKSFGNYAVNVQITDGLFAACRRLDITNVVLASTYGVYGRLPSPFREDTVAPASFYGLSKLVCEHLGPLHGLPLKSLRFAQLLGADERTGFMLRTFLDNARSGRPLRVFGSGLGARDYLYVKDAAAACAAALRRPEISGPYNAGSNHPVTTMELARAVAAIIGQGRSAVINDRAEADDPVVSWMDSTRFMDTFGWRPRFTLEQALQDIRHSYEETLI